MASGDHSHPKKSKQNRDRQRAPRAKRPYQRPPRTKTDEQLVITPSRAIADGISADELTEIAEWHDKEAAEAEKGGRDPDAGRHVRMARRLRVVAAELRRHENQTERAAA